MSAEGDADLTTAEEGAGDEGAMSVDSGLGETESSSVTSTSAESDSGTVTGDQFSVDSGISNSTAPNSGTANLPSECEKMDTATRTQQWVEESFQVFVKNLDGKTFTIDVNRDDEVTAFREKVCQKVGVPAEQQRLTLQEGRTLEDGKRLRDYNVKKHSTIYLQGRLRGGTIC